MWLTSKGLFVYCSFRNHVYFVEDSWCQSSSLKKERKNQQSFRFAVFNCITIIINIIIVIGSKQKEAISNSFLFLHFFHRSLICTVVATKGISIPLEERKIEIKKAFFLNRGKNVSYFLKLMLTMDKEKNQTIFFFLCQKKK